MLPEIIIAAAVASTPVQANTLVATSPQTSPSTAATTSYHRVNVDGVEIFYREAGPRDAPTIVLLHGYPSSSRMYDPLIPLLADRYHVFAPDYPGFGNSEAPSPDRYHYTFDHLAISISGLLDQLKINRYVLFMQDYGGPVGFRIALSDPGKVQAIIVQNANAYQEGLGVKWGAIAKYWKDPAAHPEQLDAFMSLEGARQRHLGKGHDATSGYGGTASGGSTNINGGNGGEENGGAAPNGDAGGQGGKCPGGGDGKTGNAPGGGGGGMASKFNKLPCTEYYGGGGGAYSSITYAAGYFPLFSAVPVVVGAAGAKGDGATKDGGPGAAGRVTATWN
jgi:hypothetical protein